MGEIFLKFAPKFPPPKSWTLPRRIGLSNPFMNWFIQPFHELVYPTLARNGLSNSLHELVYLTLSWIDLSNPFHELVYPTPLITWFIQLFHELEFIQPYHALVYPTHFKTSFIETPLPQQLFQVDYVCTMYVYVGKGGYWISLRLYNWSDLNYTFYSHFFDRFQPP